MVKGTRYDLLDKGYVILKDYMGTDLSPVNDARVSYDKESEELTDRDIRLLKYLGKHGHTSPFRHSIVKLEVYAPLVVARQWWKHIIGSEHGEGFDRLTSWNESSRRYITEEPTFHIVQPHEWRSKPENSKQGSGEPIEYELGSELSKALVEHVMDSMALYEGAMARGVCAEQARLFLPAYGMYVRWVWTGSLQAMAHFVNLRNHPEAQYEIQVYAQAVEEIIRELFPHASGALLDG